MLQDLTGSWAGQHAWTLLDTGFAQGSYFLEVCRLWRDDPARPGVLHYVAFAEASESATLTSDALAAAALATGISALGLEDVTDELSHLYPGFNRILLAGGHISLTLCIGNMADSLKALRAQADSVLMNHGCVRLDDAMWAQLALNCRTGTKLYTTRIDATAALGLSRHGFSPFVLKEGDAAVAQFLPRWRPKTSRRLVSAPVIPKRCAVIGGGLSGAATAHALALRGWQVVVYDTLPAPAGGASGLPVGLCVSLHSADENPLSRLTQQGVRLTLAHARSSLRSGRDWLHTGVLEKGDAAKGKADELHVHAAWIKPAALVNAWLNHPSIHWVGNFEVSSLQRGDGVWQLSTKDATLREEADIVVFANAHGCRTLIEPLQHTGKLAGEVLKKLNALQQLNGMLSIGPDAGGERTQPINGSGSWVGNVPAQTGAFWAAGATYEPLGQGLIDTAARHAENLRKLQNLSVQQATLMRSALEKGELTHWSGTRCVTHDRLPLVGPLEQADAPSLWICAGMGSRGMSLVALCAELLAAYIGSEPLPLHARLAQSLSVNRHSRGGFHKETAN